MDEQNRLCALYQVHEYNVFSIVERQVPAGFFPLSMFMSLNKAKGMTMFSQVFCEYDFDQEKNDLLAYSRPIVAAFIRERLRKNRGRSTCGDTLFQGNTLVSSRTGCLPLGELNNLFKVIWIRVLTILPCNLRWATPNLNPFHSLFYATSTVMINRPPTLLAQYVGLLLCTASNTLPLTFLLWSLLQFISVISQLSIK